MQNLADLPDDVLARVAGLLHVVDCAALSRANARFSHIFSYYACAACDHPLFTLAKLRPVPPVFMYSDYNYLCPCPAELAETTRPFAERVPEHHATSHPRSACAHCGAFVALLVDGGPLGPVHCVYKKDAVLVAPPAVMMTTTPDPLGSSWPRRDRDLASYYSSSNPGDTTTPGAAAAAATGTSTTYGCSTCHHEVAHETQLRQRLHWDDEAGYSDQVLAFTRLLPRGGAVDPVEDDGIFPSAHVGNWIFSLRNVRCAGCLTLLGWHLASLHPDQSKRSDDDDNDDDDDDDDAVERCPVAPELVGRFLLVGDAIANLHPVTAVDKLSLCVVDSDCNPPSSMQLLAASLVA